METANLPSTFAGLRQLFEAEGSEDEVVTLTDSDLLNDPINCLPYGNGQILSGIRDDSMRQKIYKSRILRIEQRMLGAEHPTTLRTMSDLAGTVSDQGRWNEAEAMQAQVLDIRERLLGANHPDALGSVNDLSLTLSYCGKWNEAEELQLQVLKIQIGSRASINSDQHK